MPIKNISRIRTLGIFDLIKEEENLLVIELIKKFLQ